MVAGVIMTKLEFGRPNANCKELVQRLPVEFLADFQSQVAFSELRERREDG